jgi:hypothetical protein
MRLFVLAGLSHSGRFRLSFIAEMTISPSSSVLIGGALAVVAADVTLRRTVALDLKLLFSDAAVLRFRDVAMEGVDIFRLRWFAAPDLTLARPKAPQIAGRALQWAALAWPAHDDTSAYYAAEVQSVLRPEIRSHVLCKSGRNNNRRAFPPPLNFWQRTHRFERDAISLAFFIG